MKNCKVLNHDKVLKRREGVFARKNFDGSISLLNCENENCYFVIDGVAAAFWDKIDGKSSVEKILTKVSLKHKVKAEYYAREAQKFIKDLLAAKLISY